MKVYAQHGSQAGSKIQDGFTQKVIDGVIFGPRDIGIDALRQQLETFSSNNPDADLLFDPQYYTCLLAASSQVRLGALPEDYSAYFSARRPADLRRETRLVADIKSTLAFQNMLPVTHLIAPNIVISRSFDSREAAVAMDFVRFTKECHAEVGSTKAVLATLAIARDALINRRELEDFVNEITGLESPPDGIYLLVAASSAEARADIYNSEVIAGWLYLNYVFHINGLMVVNGFADILTPFLCTVGGYAGATGWWSNLRTFSLERFGPTSRGGRLPIQRYLSMSLLNRITFHELDLLKTLFPRVLNNLPSDALYEGEGSEPIRNQEVLQSWDAIAHLCKTMDGPKLGDRLRTCLRLLSEAHANYDEAKLSMSFDQKSNDEHLEAIEYGMALFKEFAELDSSSQQR